MPDSRQTIVDNGTLFGGETTRTSIIYVLDDEHGDHGRVGVVGVTVKRETFA
jgi:hypothetical protein